MSRYSLLQSLARCSAVENLNCGVPRRSKSKSKQAQALPQEHTCPHSSQWASGMKFPECEGEFKNSLMLRVGSDIVISIVHVIKRPCEVWDHVVVADFCA